MYTPHFSSYLPVSGHLGSFHTLTTVNNAARYMAVQIKRETVNLPTAMGRSCGRNDREEAPYKLHRKEWVLSLLLRNRYNLVGEKKGKKRIEVHVAWSLSHV